MVNFFFLFFFFHLQVAATFVKKGNTWSRKQIPLSFDFLVILLEKKFSKESTFLNFSGRRLQNPWP